MCKYDFCNLNSSSDNIFHTINLTHTLMDSAWRTITGKKDRFYAIEGAVFHLFGTCLIFVRRLRELRRSADTIGRAAMFYVSLIFVISILLQIMYSIQLI